MVGGWNTVFGYAVWALMQYVLGSYLHYVVVILLAWPIAVLNACLGYRYIVFRRRGPMLKELPRFSLVYLATLVVNLALLPVALGVLPFNIYVIQVLFTVVVVVCSYLGHKYYSFGGGHHGVACERKIIRMRLYQCQPGRQFGSEREMDGVLAAPLCGAGSAGYGGAH